MFALMIHLYVTTCTRWLVCWVTDLKKHEVQDLQCQNVIVRSLQKEIHAFGQMCRTHFCSISYSKKLRLTSFVFSRIPSVLALLVF